MMKQLVIILGIGILIFLVLVATQFPPLWSLMSARAPRPEITYGEFAFRLEYEINGEAIVIEDSVIVEYGGTSWDAGIGNHNVWNSRLASGGPEIIELYRSDTTVVFIRILGILRGGYLLGSDSDTIQDDSYIELPSVIRLNLNEELLTSQQERERDTFFSDTVEPNWRFFIGTGFQIEEKELLDTYGIRLISFEYDPPIINSFR